MANCEPLKLYGALVLAVAGALILVPYWRRRADLVSLWNVFLLSVGIYTGLGCFEAALSPIRFPGTQWFQPTANEVNWFMLASTLFLVTLIPSYYYNPIGRIASRTVIKWPPQQTAMYLVVIAVCFLVVVAAPLTMRFPFIGKSLANLSHKAIIFAAVFGCMLWLRQRFNPFWLALFLGTLVTACLLAMLYGASRRLLLSVFLVPVVGVYLAFLRSWRPTRAILVVGVACFGLLMVSFMYDSFRRFNRSGWKERTVSNIVQEVRNVNQRDWWGAFSADKLRGICQSDVHYSLLTMRLVETNRLKAKPLNTLAFVSVVPIPRNYWPDKPRPLGGVILEEALNWPFGGASMGVNVVGHVAYEGGLWVAPLYAFLIATALRWFDEIFTRDPTNPFLFAIFVSAAPHILGWIRGDIGVMTWESMECILYAAMLCIGCRLLFGTEWSGRPRGYATPVPNRRLRLN